MITANKLKYQECKDTILTQSTQANERHKVNYH